MKIIKRSESKMAKLESVRVMILAIGTAADGSKAKVRQQFDYIDVKDSKPEDVYVVIERALDAASKRA